MAQVTLVCPAPVWPLELPCALSNGKVRKKYDWCSNRKRAACYADDGLCGSCLDGFTLSGFGPGVSPDNLGCAPVVINACGDSEASNYRPLALPDDDTDCVYPEIVVESALEEQEEEVGSLVQVGFLGMFLLLFQNWMLKFN